MNKNRNWTADGSVVEDVDAPFTSDICICSKDGIANLAEDSEETEANARLIASAPELLKACKESLPVISGSVNDAMDVASIVYIIKQAIAKAEGK